MEILIALTILMVGLIPMLAVFQVALANLNRSIEDTYASAIAQSVIDSIKVGVKDLRYETSDGRKVFILDHDGSEHLDPDRRGFLKDLDLGNPANVTQMLTRDYAILLPRHTDTEASPTGGTPLGRACLYPRQRSGSDLPYLGGSDYIQTRVTGADGSILRGRKVKVEKVYPLGRKLRDSALPVEQADTYAQYSFSFTIRAAKAPNPLAPNADMKTQSTIPGLYEVIVSIYRNFSPNPLNRRNDPVNGREFIALVSE
jgi:hypothetical protein